MNRKPLIKGLLRLFAVSIMLMGLLALSQDTEVKASPFVCVHNNSICYYNCAVSHQPNTPEMAACEAQCEMDYWTCDENQTDDLPAPWPVINNGLSGCLSGCQQCFELSTFEARFSCYDGCSNWCFENYPRH